MSVRAGILVTGTEVLSATITDRNGPWISERLAELGVEVSYIQVVGDRPADMEAALGFLRDQGVGIIVTSGGLGPTADDITAEVVARFAGRNLLLDEEMEEKIMDILREFAKRFNFDVEALRDANRKQAMIPEGAAVIDPAGTAPGLVVPAGEQTVIVLPGPPRELHAMWEPAIATEPAQAALADADEFTNFSLKLFGVPESEIAQSLREIEEGTSLDELEITTCLRRGELHVDVRHRPGAEQQAEALKAGLVERQGTYFFSERGESIEDVLMELLGSQKLGLAESCTGGLLAVRLTNLPRASGYFAGSVVSYSNEAKTQLLGVPAELISEHGAVSPEVAEAMADGALERFEAEIACAVTGIAGPDGGTEEKPVGYVCFCVKRRSGEMLARDPVLPGDRGDIRDRSSTVALHLLRLLLEGRELPR